MNFVADYVHELKERAKDRAREGAPSAQVYDRIAEELEARMRAWQLEEVTLQEAVELSGYSASQLRRLINTGQATLRRCDLPRKPGHGVARPEPVPDGDTSLAERILQRRGARGGGRR